MGACFAVVEAHGWVGLWDRCKLCGGLTINKVDLHIGYGIWLGFCGRHNIDLRDLVAYLDDICTAASEQVIWITLNRANCTNFANVGL